MPMENLFTSTTSLRVLLAEPDRDARQRYVEALRPLGCEAIETSDGREALVEALVRQPSVVVMETRLPLVNGPALCEVLRRDAQTRCVPIVALASDPALEAERIRRAGATSILVKPFGDDALCAEVRRLVEAPPVATPPPVFMLASELNLAAALNGTRKRMANSKLHVRCTTTTPPAAPPALRCPTCDGPLMYERSHLGGVSQRQPEQWDDYVCPVCGTFEYRHR